jgi:hypothetical protein
MLLHRRSSVRTFALLAVTLTALAPHASDAQGITDPAGDFLPSYIGPKNADMDVLLASAVFDGTTFHFRSEQGGVVGATANEIFVWGVNRGAGTSRFPVIAPGVLFDFVVILNPNGPSTARDLINNIGFVLPTGGASFNGNVVQGDVPLAWLVSEGLAPSQYTVNLWPRINGQPNEFISDFAPNNSNFQVTTTPEPSSALLLGPALLGIGGFRLRRRGN